ncbi:DUF2946 family protein [Quisquiliibacterium transsilvanicum]|uniref:DUF2946 domain-containing protein n=1 Tax=Quisquiliibacterium transsilvanicum TaxID=1549638 RepID=A0A7W8M925_9BURK|nr:DUF2946 family protein [Quisquiliibacterium transsilvanicum]MBB5272413.1 hypothetical protein [Quisquiliibacterium transsilvanicum]
MFRGNALRPGAWLALLALVSSLLAPLAGQARTVGLDQALSLAVCSAGGLPGPVDDAPPPGTHQGGPACAYCQTGPAALPDTHGQRLGPPETRALLQISLRPEPGVLSKSAWPPLPARGPPRPA